MANVGMAGGRLAYVSVPLEGTVKRFRYVLEPREIGVGKNKRTLFDRRKVLQDEPAGFMVYFPRGHCIRVKTAKQLRHYKLDRPPHIIDLAGLVDTNSPLGKLLTSQDEAERRGAFQKLEDKVIRLVRIRAGADTVPETEQEDIAA